MGVLDQGPEPALGEALRGFGPGVDPTADVAGVDDDGTEAIAFAYEPADQEE